MSRYEADGVTPTFTHRPGGRVNPFIQDENTKNESDGWSYNSRPMCLRPIEHLTLKTQFATQYDGAVNGYWTGTYSQYGQGVNKPYASRSKVTTRTGFGTIRLPTRIPLPATTN